MVFHRHNLPEAKRMNKNYLIATYIGTICQKPKGWIKMI
jgi:hypothetical protein